MEQGQSKKVEYKIGLMGGTFDPIHNAHLEFARIALETEKLDEVWFVPAGNPYLHKHNNVSPVEDRNNMVSLAIQSDSRFSISFIEQEEQAEEGKTYTSETLEKLHERFPDYIFYFLLGSDQIFQLDSWHKPEDLFRLAIFLTAKRPEGKGSEVSIEKPDRHQNLPVYQGDIDTGSVFIEKIEYLKQKYGGKIHIIPFKEMDMSSTEIRRRVGMGESIADLVPKCVEEYIRLRGLYSAYNIQNA